MEQRCHNPSLFSVAIVALIIVGCLEVEEPAPEIPPASCAALAELMERCLGVRVEPDTCDEALAAQWVTLSCEGLTMRLRDDKSDFSLNFNATACDWGIYAQCPAVSCEADLDEPEPRLPPSTLEEPSRCAEGALLYEGCGACAYYACREVDANCGPDGYLMRYAHHYCERFRLVTEPNVSPEGQLWLRQIRRCLIETLEVEAPPGSDCDMIATRGFGAHPSCYVETGFCELPVSDWMAVLNTIEHGDFSFRESLLTGQGCLEAWLGLSPACESTCEGRECGSDGCGGSCGECSEATICSDVGECESRGASSVVSTTSCSGRCGATSEDGLCFCDDSCFSFGDCCRDYSEVCP